MIDWTSILLGILAGTTSGFLVSIPTSILLAWWIDKKGLTWR